MASRLAETRTPEQPAAAGRRVGRRLQARPRWLERAHRIAHATLARIAPRLSQRAAGRAARWIRGPEELFKSRVFDCRSCGQCILHCTGMTCPMTCPKELRNGPCGGVRADGGCEVAPERPCIWVEAVRRARSMATGGAELIRLQPPLDRGLGGLSAWHDLLTGVDRDREVDIILDKRRWLVHGR